MTRLHHHRAIEPVLRQQRLELRRVKIPAQLRHVVINPRVILWLIAPVVVVGVNAQHALLHGSGTAR
jgi:hypothetical protein